MSDPANSHKTIEKLDSDDSLDIYIEPILCDLSLDDISFGGSLDFEQLEYAHRSRKSIVESSAATRPDSYRRGTLKEVRLFGDTSRSPSISSSDPLSPIQIEDEYLTSKYEEDRRKSRVAASFAAHRPRDLKIVFEDDFATPDASRTSMPRTSTTPESSSLSEYNQRLLEAKAGKKQDAGTSLTKKLSPIPEHVLTEKISRTLSQTSSVRLAERMSLSNAENRTMKRAESSKVLKSVPVVRKPSDVKGKSVVGVRGVLSKVSDSRASTSSARSSIERKDSPIEHETRQKSPSAPAAYGLEVVDARGLEIRDQNIVVRGEKIGEQQTLEELQKQFQKNKALRQELLRQTVEGREMLEKQERLHQERIKRDAGMYERHLRAERKRIQQQGGIVVLSELEQLERKEKKLREEQRKAKWERERTEELKMEKEREERLQREALEAKMLREEQEMSAKFREELDEKLQKQEEFHAKLKARRKSAAKLQLDKEDEEKLRKLREEALRVEAGQEYLALKFKREQEAAERLRKKLENEFKLQADQEQALKQREQEAEEKLRKQKESELRLQAKQEQALRQREQEAKDLALKLQADRELAIKLQKEDQTKERLREENEAALRLQGERELALKMQKDQEAEDKLRRKKESELRLQAKQEQALRQREQEAKDLALKLQADQELALRLQKDEEERLRKENETAMRLQAEKELALKLQKEQAAKDLALKLQADKELAIKLQKDEEERIRKENETALRLQAEKELALKLQKDQEAKERLQRENEENLRLQAAKDLALQQEQAAEKLRKDKEMEAFQRQTELEERFRKKRESEERLRKEKELQEQRERELREERDRKLKAAQESQQREKEERDRKQKEAQESQQREKELKEERDRQQKAPQEERKSEKDLREVRDRIAAQMAAHELEKEKEERQRQIAAEDDRQRRRELEERERKPVSAKLQRVKSTVKVKPGDEGVETKGQRIVATKTTAQPLKQPSPSGKSAVILTKKVLTVQPVATKSSTTTKASNEEVAESTRLEESLIEEVKALRVQVDFNASVIDTENPNYLSQLPAIPNEPQSYSPILYTFRVKSKDPNHSLANLSTQVPPFYVQLDHTIAVIWTLFNAEAKKDNLGISQLQWALFFLQSIHNIDGIPPRDVQLVIETIQEYLIDEYADMSEETVIYGNDKLSDYMEIPEKCIPFSINYSQMIEKSEQCAQDEPVPTVNESVLEEFESLKQITGIDSIDLTNTLSREKMIVALCDWKSEQMDKIQKEIGELHIVENMLKEIDDTFGNIQSDEDTIINCRKKEEMMKKLACGCTQ